MAAPLSSALLRSPLTPFASVRNAPTSARSLSKASNARATASAKPANGARHTDARSLHANRGALQNSKVHIAPNVNAKDVACVQRRLLLRRRQYHPRRRRHLMCLLHHHRLPRSRHHRHRLLYRRRHSQALHHRHHRHHHRSTPPHRLLLPHASHSPNSKAPTSPSNCAHPTFAESVQWRMTAYTASAVHAASAWRRSRLRW